MDLEEANKKYIYFKNALELDQKAVDNLEKEGKKLFSQQKKYENALKRAEKSKDVDAQRAAQKELRQIEKEIEKYKYQLEIKKDQVELFKGKIDEKIAEIQQHPDMKKAMDEALVERYKRQLSKLEPEKEKIVKEKEENENNKKQLNVLKQVIEEEPKNRTLLVDFIRAKEEIRKLNDELGKLDYKDSKDQARIAEITMKLIPDAQKGIKENGKNLVSNINKKGIAFTEKELNGLAEGMLNNGLALDKKGNLDINQTLDKNILIADENIKNLGKQLKSYDKKIGNYTLAKEQLENQIPRQPEDKPKWYEFRKRFAAWREQKNQKKLPEPEQRIDQRTMFMNELTRDAFRAGIGESGKFDGTYERTTLKAAKAQRKEQEGREPGDD